MATLKMMGGGTKTSEGAFSTSRSLKEYFLCCFKENSSKKERLGPDGTSEETKLQESAERGNASGTSRPGSTIQKEGGTEEVKAALSSALSQINDQPRPKSVASVKSVKIEEKSDPKSGRNSRATLVNERSKEDVESISSKISRLLTPTPKPKPDQMGGQVSSQEENVANKQASEDKNQSGSQHSNEDRTIPKESISENQTETTQEKDNVLSETIVENADENLKINNVLASTPNPQQTLSLNQIDAEQEKQLFDVSDLQKDESTFAGYSCGSLVISMKHEERAFRVIVTVHEAKDIPSKDRGGHSSSQIHSALLPNKKIRHKTKILPGDNPVFNENFDFRIKEEEIETSQVRLRLYGIERMKKNRLVGEVSLPLTPEYLNGTKFTIALEPRSNLKHGESSTSLNSVNNSMSEYSLAPGEAMELMLGLAYNPITGRMAVEVHKGSNFKNTAVNRPPDSYVKIALMAPNQQEINRSKTTIRRGQPHPIFKETFMFQVPQFQLADVSLLVSVFVVKSLKRKEMLGWFTMGQTSSSEDDSSHWIAMLESKGEQVSRWHNLLDP